MQESMSQIPTVNPITVTLSPRDLFVVHAAIEAAQLELTTLDIPHAGEMLSRYEDLEHRFRKLLKDGGHVK